MKTFFKKLTLAVVGLVLGQAAGAATPTPIDTLNCVYSGGTSLKHTVYAFTLGTGLTTPRFFTVYFLNTLIDTYTYEEVFGSGFSYCEFGKLPGWGFDNASVVDVNLAGLGANVGAFSVQQDSVAQSYTEVTFQYNFLLLGNNPAPAAPMPSKEEQAKALAAFKARGLALPR